MAKPKDNPATPSFEEGLSRLEGLLGQLESGELGLEDGVKVYQEGVELLAVLRADLSGAENRVEALTKILQDSLQQVEGDDSFND